MRLKRRPFIILLLLLSPSSLLLCLLGQRRATCFSGFLLRLLRSSSWAGGTSEIPEIRIKLGLSRGACAPCGRRGCEAQAQAAWLSTWRSRGECRGG